MNAPVYRLRVETYPYRETTRIAYGIVEMAGDAVLQEIGDITADKAALEALIECCNRLALAPLQLRDVVEDFLCDA
jgi:hypothetical protein